MLVGDSFAVKPSLSNTRWSVFTKYINTILWKILLKYISILSKPHQSTNLKKEASVAIMANFATLNRTTNSSYIIDQSATLVVVCFGCQTARSALLTRFCWVICQNSTLNNPLPLQYSTLERRLRTWVRSPAESLILVSFLWQLPSFHRPPRLIHSSPID